MVMAMQHQAALMVITVLVFVCVLLVDSFYVYCLIDVAVGVDCCTIIDSKAPLKISPFPAAEALM